MKAWELLKHLEEGGQLTRDRDTYKLTDGVLEYKGSDNRWYSTTGGLTYLLRTSEKYKIVVPKRKTVVEAYVDFGDGPSYLYKALGVVCVTTNSEYADNYEAKVRITLEEL